MASSLHTPQSGYMHTYLFFHICIHIQKFRNRNSWQFWSLEQQKDCFLKGEDMVLCSVGCWLDARLQHLDVLSSTIQAFRSYEKWKKHHPLCFYYIYTYMKMNRAVNTNKNRRNLQRDTRLVQTGTSVITDTI